MLQTRNGKRTGPAAVRIAVEMVKEGLLTPKEALLRVEPEQLNQLLHPVLDESKPLKVIAKGLPASPGAAVGRVVFTADEAVVKGKTAPGDSGARRDRARRYSRHGSGRGHSDLARRHDLARGRGDARHGQALRGGLRRSGSGRKEAANQGRPAHHQGRRLDFTRRFHGPRHSGQGRPGRARSPQRRLRGVHEVGGRSARTGRARQRGYSARRHGGASNSAPRALAFAAPSTCSSPRTACRTCSA